jgi:hypothetical protein
MLGAPGSSTIPICRVRKGHAPRAHVCWPRGCPGFEGRIGGRRKKLDDTKRREIAEAVISGRKTAAQMARMFGVSLLTVSRIVAAFVVAPR